MRQYIILVGLIAVVAVLAFLAGVAHQTHRGTARQIQAVREVAYNYSLTSAGEKFRVLQDLRLQNPDRAVMRLSKLIDVDLLQASATHPAHLEHIVLGLADWPALRETRDALQLGHTNDADNALIEAELDWLMSDELKVANTSPEDVATVPRH